jgi:hypothetical protein
LQRLIAIGTTYVMTGHPLWQTRKAIMANCYRPRRVQEHLAKRVTQLNGCSSIRLGISIKVFADAQPQREATGLAARSQRVVVCRGGRCLL